MSLGFVNKDLVHAYRRVNLDLVWQAVEQLPAIERQMAAIIGAEWFE